MAYVNAPTLHSTLREWRAHMTHPARAAALVGVGVIVTLMAPFGTGEAMRFVPRLAYWLVLVGLSYTAGYVAHLVADRLFPDSIVRRIAIAGPLTGIAVLGIVQMMNWAALGQWAGGAELAGRAANVLVIATIIAVVFQIAHAPDPASQPPAPPALLDRLPLDKRAPLVALSVEDHYVRIRTLKGEEMVLMRLADAMREVGDTPGAQVHRSHWVAFGQVRAARRDGDRAILTMATGPEIPVSRANLPKIKEAGLLPR
jgi:hypothetical protein